MAFASPEGLDPLPQSVGFKLLLLLSSQKNPLKVNLGLNNFFLELQCEIPDFSPLILLPRWKKKPQDFSPPPKIDRFFGVSRGFFFSRKKMFTPIVWENFFFFWTITAFSACVCVWEERRTKNPSSLSVWHQQEKEKKYLVVKEFLEEKVGQGKYYYYYYY